MSRVLLLAPVLTLSQSSCYLTRAAWEEARILAARRPIVELVRDRGTTSPVRQKLRLVLAARAFARDSLGLLVGQSFTTYSDVGRDTLVLVLSAAHRDTLKAHSWSFPVVGRLPYKGFFDFAAARGEADALEARGFDTYLRPSDAFSTLGWFNDPLLSTTVGRDSLDLINTVLHELTHTTFFAKHQAAFNESFANFVGARGAERFFRARGATAAAAETESGWRDEKVLAVFWASLAQSLDSAFALYPGSRPLRLAARERVYADGRQRLIHDVGPRLRTIGPRYTERVVLNNASVMARLVYASELEIFDDVYAREGFDLGRTIHRIMALARARPSDPFGAVRAWLRERG